jgi:hypothetical protein
MFVPILSCEDEMKAIDWVTNTVTLFKYNVTEM